MSGLSLEERVMVAQHKARNARKFYESSASSYQVPQFALVLLEGQAEDAQEELRDLEHELRLKTVADAAELIALRKRVAELEAKGCQGDSPY